MPGSFRPVPSALDAVWDGGRNGAVYTLDSWWHGSAFFCAATSVEEEVKSPS